MSLPGVNRKPSTWGPVELRYRESPRHGGMWGAGGVENGKRSFIAWNARRAFWWRFIGKRGFPGAPGCFTVFTTDRDFVPDPWGVTL